jgi:hypothetical protein
VANATYHKVEKNPKTHKNLHEILIPAYFSKKYLGRKMIVEVPKGHAQTQA